VLGASRKPFIFTLAGGATTAFVQPLLGLAVTSGQAIDITLRIGWPQIEQGASVTSPISTGNTILASAAVVGGGTSYTNGDVLTVVGGTLNTVAATLNVTGVSGGVITSVSVNNAGNYRRFPTNPVSVTGGTGTGATFNLTPTVNTAAVMRNADGVTALLTLANAFTMRASGTPDCPLAFGSRQYILNASDGIGTNNRLSMFRDLTTGFPTYLNVVGGTGQGTQTIVSSAWAQSVQGKIAARDNGSADQAGCFNGGVIKTSATSVPSGLIQLQIGGAGTTYWNGLIDRVTVYPSYGVPNSGLILETT